MMRALVTSMPIFVCAFWSVLLLLDLLEGGNKSKRGLLAYMLTTCGLYFAHYTFYNRLVTLLPYVDSFYGFANPAVYPLYYLYIREVTLPQGNKSARWVLLPSLLCGVSIGILYALMSPEETASFISTYLYKTSNERLDGLALAQVWAHGAYKQLFGLQIPLIAFLLFRHIHSFNRQVEANFANIDNKKLRLANTILILFTILAVISFVSSNIIGREKFFNSPFRLTISSSMYSILIFMIGYVGYRQEFTIKDLQKEQESPSAQSKPDEAEPGAYERLSQSIDQLVDSKQLYLRPDLKISDIASELHTNRAYIYQAINIYQGVSFAEYINRRRIAYAMQLFRKDPQRDIPETALKCGYSSLSSFYRNFRLYQGGSPKEYCTSVL